MSRHQYIRTLAYLFIFLLLLCSVESGTALTIFYSGEENGQLALHGCGSEQVGGLAHRHTLLLDLRTELDAVLNLHTGNLIDAADGNLDFSAEWIYQIGLSALDAMGVDVLCLGTHELSFSSETLAALHANHQNIAFTCANAKQGVVPPYLIQRVSSMNVAVVGLISETYTQEPYQLELAQSYTALLVSYFSGFTAFVPARPSSCPEFIVAGFCCCIGESSMLVNSVFFTKYGKLTTPTP